MSDKPPPIAAPTPTTKVARNLIRSVFEYPHKRCNSQRAKFQILKIVGEELRATLLGKYHGGIRTAQNDPLTAKGPNDPLTTKGPNDLPFLGR